MLKMSKWKLKWSYKSLKILLPCQKFIDLRQKIESLTPASFVHNKSSKLLNEAYKEKYKINRSFDNLL